MLTNAIYFKGNWSAKFDAKTTKDDNFWLPAGPVQVPMMMRKAIYRYKETADLQILELPYFGDRLSMLVLLPREKDGLPNLESQLTSDFLAEAKNKFWNHEVIVHLPKFKVEAAFTLNEALKALGMPDAFKKAVFRADHPFIFIIRENQTGSILFLGRMANP